MDVVLPAPFGPRKPKTSPLGTDRVRSRTATLAPNSFRSARTSRAGSAKSLPDRLRHLEDQHPVARSGDGEHLAGFWMEVTSSPLAPFTSTSRKVPPSEGIGTSRVLRQSMLRAKILASSALIPAIRRANAPSSARSTPWGICTLGPGDWKNMKSSSPRR